MLQYAETESETKRKNCNAVAEPLTPGLKDVFNTTALPFTYTAELLDYSLDKVTFSCELSILTKQWLRKF